MGNQPDPGTNPAGPQPEPQIPCAFEEPERREPVVPDASEGESSIDDLS